MAIYEDLPHAPFSFVLSGLVKVSEKRRHPRQGPQGGGKGRKLFLSAPGTYAVT